MVKETFLILLVVIVICKGQYEYESEQVQDDHSGGIVGTVMEVLNAAVNTDYNFNQNNYEEILLGSDLPSGVTCQQLKRRAQRTIANLRRNCRTNILS